MAVEGQSYVQFHNEQKSLAVTLHLRSYSVQCTRDRSAKVPTQSTDVGVDSSSRDLPRMGPGTSTSLPIDWPMPIYPYINTQPCGDPLEEGNTTVSYGFETKAQNAKSLRSSKTSCTACCCRRCCASPFAASSVLVPQMCFDRMGRGSFQNKEWTRIFWNA